MKYVGKAVAAFAVAVMALAGCGGGGDPLSKTDEDTKGQENKSGQGGGEALVVGGANFTESKVLAEIYAGALNAEGIQATTRTGIGSREAYLGALKDGSVDIFPEYTGNLALHYDPDATATSAQGWYDAAKNALPKEFTIFAMAPAQDNDSVTVTRETADQYDLKKVSDLRPVAPELVIGGPPEWLTREKTGVPALEKTYGLEFQGEYKRFNPGLQVQALKNGQIDVTNIFTTDPAIFLNDFVVLEDDKHVFPLSNVVPIGNKAATGEEKIGATLDAVSAELDTETVSDLVKQVDIDKKEPKAVAQEWLKSNGFA
ncbi:MAG TPA: ABC transporter substrate-binding protein [Actinopolymorphaceae bacterium]